jgi:phosphoribosylformylglycinamidine synthase
MAHACRLAGSDIVDIVHISEILHGEKCLDDYDFLNLPGGFLDGDDLGAAKAGANRILHAPVRGREDNFCAQLERFIRAGKLVLGVCNGFQLMVKLGLLPAFDKAWFVGNVTLTHNDSGRYEDRWTYLKVNAASPCVFTKELVSLYLPVRHGEGKLIADDEETLARIRRENLACLCYSDAACAQPVMNYPDNPNGSADAIAGLCDPTGRLMGLMPHPEAFLHRTNHPRWTREDLPEEGQGVSLFRNAVDFIRSGAF